MFRVHPGGRDLWPLEAQATSNKPLPGLTGSPRVPVRFGTPRRGYNAGDLFGRPDRWNQIGSLKERERERALCNVEFPNVIRLFHTASFWTLSPHPSFSPLTAPPPLGPSIRTYLLCSNMSLDTTRKSSPPIRAWSRVRRPASSIFADVPVRWLPELSCGGSAETLHRYYTVVAMEFSGRSDCCLS